MNLTKTQQINIEEINQLNFDIAFFSCGYEKRSSFLFGSKKINCLNNKVFVFDNDDRLNIKSNKAIFEKSKSCSFIYSNGESQMDICKTLNVFFENFPNQKEVNILIDYSSMTKVWFSSFLNYFMNLNFNEKLINLYYSYSHSKYTPPMNDNDYGISVEPVSGFCNISLPDKPTALIIGLGYDKKMAIGLSQYLDAESYIFYSDDSYSKDFSNSVKEENRELLMEVKEDNVYLYPIMDLTTTENILHSLLVDLLQTNRIVLAPCGPKIFTLICLTESIKLENVDVWRISSSKNRIDVSDKLPDGSISVYKVTFESN